MVSIKSIDSSSTIKAGSFVIFNLVFNHLSKVISIFIKSTNPNSSKDVLTLLINSLVFSSVQYILIFIFFIILSNKKEHNKL
jgi:hypothetical protein